MNIRVVSAIGGDIIELSLPATTKVADLKREIAQRKRIPTSIFVLAFRGTEIRNENQTLSDVGVNDYDKLYLIARTEGGN